jgi:ribosome-binding factor A
MRKSRFHIRLEKQIKEKLSLILLRGELNDPLVSSVTIYEVILSPNLKSALVRFSLYNPKHSTQEALKVLDKAKGHLRACLAKTISLRQIPFLKFEETREIELNEKLNEIFKEIKKDYED